jgi:hypothetical protein
MPPVRLSKWSVFLCCFLVTLGLRIRTDADHPGGPQWDEPIDHHKYLYVAEHPIGSFHIQPTCWRIGVPVLAKILPFSTYRNFDILSVLFVGLSGCMLYLWLLAIPLRDEQALLGVLLFYSLGAAAKLLLRIVTSPDPASYFFILLALYAIYRGNDYLFAAALALGVVTKETVALVGPLYYSLKAVSFWDPGRFKKLILVCAPAACVLIAIHVLIPAWNDHDDYVQSLPSIYTQVSAGMVKNDLLTAFRGTIGVYRQMSPIFLVRSFTYGALGLTLFLPFFAPRANREPLIRWAPYWVAVLLTMLIALNADRRISSLFPVLIVLGLNGLDVLADLLNVKPAHFMVLFGMILGLLLLKKDITTVPFDMQAAVALFCLTWAVARAARRFERNWQTAASE